jgi:type IV pilus assembly protein PilB
MSDYRKGRKHGDSEAHRSNTPKRTAAGDACKRTRVADERLAAFLVKSGVLTASAMEAMGRQPEYQKVALFDGLLASGTLSEEALADAVGGMLELPRLSLSTVSLDPEAMNLLGEKGCRKYVCVALRIEGKALVVAIANPADYEAIRDIEFIAGMPVRPAVTTRTEIGEALEQFFGTEDRLQDFLANVATPSQLLFVAQEKAEAESEQLDLEAADLPPVVKMCNVLISDGIKNQASDIHIEPAVNFVQVRMRVDGVLREYMQIPKWLQSPLVSRLKILSKLDIAERRVPQDGRIKVNFLHRSVDLRVSTLPTHFGEKVVLRILGNTDVPSLQSLGFAESQLPIMESVLHQPQGMILVTGPTGAGKSTTLYSMVMALRSPQVNIITVEDPIEYQLPGINQVQVNPKAGLTFASCLRSILRQDPDVILLGEIRDLETAEIAFQAAMTGHLVLSTLHTNSSLATVARLLDLGVDPQLITSAVSMILAQRLVRQTCARCKTPHSPPARLLERLRIQEGDFVFHQGQGCAACAMTGFSGRLGVYEMLRMTPSLKELIHRKAGEGELRKAAGMTGTRFLLDDAMEKTRQGLTTLEEVMRVVQLQEDEITRCPECNAFINLDFSSCPYCLTTLRHLCAQCGEELKPEWLLCPYCNTRPSADKPRSLKATAPSNFRVV